MMYALHGIAGNVPETTPGTSRGPLLLNTNGTEQIFASTVITVPCTGTMHGTPLQPVNEPRSDP